MLPEGDILAATALEAKYELWRRGDLSNLLHAGQRHIDAKLSISTAKKVYLNISRRWGKSFYLLTKAIELCLQKPGARVLYVAPFAKDAEKIATDLASTIFNHPDFPCPDDIRPEYKSVSKEFEFKNGSEIRFIGANGERARFARGVGIDIGVVDEAAEVDDLDYLVNSVMMPMTLHSKGRIFLASTPPRSPGHASTVLAKALAKDGGPGAYFHFTIHDNPLLTPEWVEAYCKEAGGAESTTWKREYLADLDTVDAESAVVPEFPKAEAAVCVEHARPPEFEHLDRYVSLDPAFIRDRSGGLFGYMDFLAGGVLVLEREFLLNRPKIYDIAKLTNEIEQEIWPGLKVRLRVVDDPAGVIAPELWEQGKLAFQRAEKHDRDRSISIMRMLVQQHKIRISPTGCPELIKQLKYATWNRSATDMERTLEGHSDLVAALWMMCRHLDLYRNPIPAGWGVKAGQLVNPRGVARPAVSRMHQALLSDTPHGRRVMSARKRR